MTTAKGDARATNRRTGSSYKSDGSLKCTTHRPAVIKIPTVIAAIRTVVVVKDSRASRRRANRGTSLGLADIRLPLEGGPTFRAEPRRQSSSAPTAPARGQAAFPFFR